MLTGCKAKEPAADTTAAAASSTMADTTSTAGNAASTATLTDGNIAALLDEANAGDSALAAAALPNLTNAEAKNFAKLMMGEHHALRVEGAKVATAQNITLQLPTPDPFKPAVEAEQSALSSMTKGAAYDSTYIAHEVGIHQAVIDWAGKNTPQNAALQQYMKTAGPTLVKHLDMGQALQKKLSGSK
jgi:predicted outer membrane protein